ncbi:MAG: peptidoglycan-binding protein [Bdellovibrionales bacterium]|nr:peptidoglycan-binding protein [Bdellovibrionales bacterium]
MEIKNIFAVTLLFGLLNPTLGQAEGTSKSEAPTTQGSQMRNDATGSNLEKHPAQEMGRVRDRGFKQDRSDRYNQAGLSTQQIREVQKALQKSDAELQIDGVWGQSTSDALTKYQRQHGLEVTGRPNSQTLANLGIKKSDRQTDLNSPN